MTRGVFRYLFVVAWISACGHEPGPREVTPVPEAATDADLQRAVERRLLAHECRVRGLMRFDEVLVDVANDATFVRARLPTPTEHDVVLRRGPYARSLMLRIDPELARSLEGSCEDGEALYDPVSDVTFDGPRLEDFEVAIAGSEIHATGVLTDGLLRRDRSGFRVRWRRVRGDLEMVEHRVWPLVYYLHGSANVVIHYSPSKWRELDAAVQRRRREGPLACLLDALFHAQRYGEVLEAVEALPIERRGAYVMLYRPAAHALAEIDRAEAFEAPLRDLHGLGYADVVMRGARGELDECAPPAGFEIEGLPE